MGDRGQVLVKPSGIYLYTHWGATDLHKDVKSAIQRSHDRWDDEEYLTRVIFCEMIRNDLMGTSGYGIGTSYHGDAYRVVEVDTAKQKVSVNNADEIVKDGKEEPLLTPLWSGTFEEFITDKNMEQKVKSGGEE